MNANQSIEFERPAGTPSKGGRPRGLPRKALLLLLALPVLVAAYKAGETAYIKRAESALLAEPNPLAEPSVKLKLGSKLKVEEVKGAWLRVSEGRKHEGWIFSGNVSAAKPDEDAGLAAIPLDASATTATAAARPLTPAATEYSERRNLAQARGDLEWVITESAKVTTADVTDYLKATKKGEFQ